MRLRSLSALLGGAAVLVGGCSGSLPNHPYVGEAGGAATTGAGGSAGSGACGLGGGMGTGGGLVLPPMSDDPTTCEDAAANRTYVGCDFWPTVTANIVWSVFDFAAIVANAGTEPVVVTVTGNGQSQTVAVLPNALGTVYLPWVPSLKGPDADSCGNTAPLTGSVQQPGGAYHLVSSAPVTVYQFSALEYRPHGGPAGKVWATCPSDPSCTAGCYSYTNDASLLLPSTAMTGNYRVTGVSGWTDPKSGPLGGATISVTGTRPNTNVTVHVAPKGHILPGGSIPETFGGGVIAFTLGAGDVVELVGDSGADNTGSLVQADQPVQVISGHPCTYMPQNPLDPACDHLEQSVLPAETLGKHYLVAPPTAPHGRILGHVVRLVGNVDGTNLAYPSGAQPKGAPSTLNAGEVVDLGIVPSAFEITGDHEFAVVTIMLGGSLADPDDPIGSQLGDPSQSNAIALEQYRQKYVFLAPTDYTENYVDVTGPMTAQMVLDGAPLCPEWTAIGGSSFGVARFRLSSGNGGAHVLTSAAPVGIQVIGYGMYTSYQYPGGLNLDVIAPPPPTM